MEELQAGLDSKEQQLQATEQQLEATQGSLIELEQALTAAEAEQSAHSAGGSSAVEGADAALGSGSVQDPEGGTGGEPTPGELLQQAQEVLRAKAQERVEHPERFVAADAGDGGLVSAPASVQGFGVRPTCGAALSTAASVADVRLVSATGMLCKTAAGGWCASHACHAVQ